MSVVHPHDRARVGAVVQHALETGEHFSHQYRAVLDDGSLRVFHARGEIATPADGRRVLLGTCQDVTDRARVESESRQRAKEQRAVANPRRPRSRGWRARGTDVGGGEDGRRT